MFDSIDYVQVEECPACHRKFHEPHIFEEPTFDDCRILSAYYEMYFEREERREAWNESFPG